MVALARDLNIFGSGLLASLTAEFVASLHHAPAWEVPALCLLDWRHHSLLFSFFNPALAFKATFV
jgi:hypothetical protein